MLAVWNMFISLYIGNHHPNWLIFFPGGGSTTNQVSRGTNEKYGHGNNPYNFANKKNAKYGDKCSFIHLCISNQWVIPLCISMSQIEKQHRNIHNDSEVVISAVGWSWNLRTLGDQERVSSQANQERRTRCGDQSGYPTVNMWICVEHWICWFSYLTWWLSIACWEIYWRLPFGCVICLILRYISLRRIIEHHLCLIDTDINIKMTSLDIKGPFVP